MEKSVAQLKRDANSGNLSLVLISRFGDSNIKPELSGTRKVLKANSTSVIISKDGGRCSYLDLPRASLVEYRDDCLTIYEPALRNLEPFELNILAKLKDYKLTPEFKRLEEIDCATDTNFAYYEEIKFFNKYFPKYIYLMGHEKQNGQIFDFNTQKIKDENLKGKIALRYDVYLNNPVN